MGPVDHRLVGAWLAARSVARGLPAPVADSGGWRVDTGLPAERRRHVFASTGDGLRRLGASIDAPDVVLKLCDTAAALRRQVPARWKVNCDACVMAGDAAPRDGRPLPPGYAVESNVTGQVAAVRIVRDGAPAASGFAVELGGVFVYDRIVVDAAHRRRGLGGAVMAALAATRRSSASRPLLVATRDGRALYEALGWTVLAPYATAQLGSA